MRAKVEQADSASTVHGEQEHVLTPFPPVARSLLYSCHRSFFAEF
jgi:hypothetical protein